MATTKTAKPRFELRKRIMNRGINDYPDSVSTNGVLMLSYNVWRNLFVRCYLPSLHKREPTYIGCSVSKDWIHFSDFIKWYNEYHRDGYDLDKDILVKGNKVYSPKLCCFIPRKINTLLHKRVKNKKGLPSGVHTNKGLKPYKSGLSIDGKHKHLGSFDTVLEAFTAFKVEKEADIKRVAIEHFNDGLITLAVYHALMLREVSIND